MSHAPIVKEEGRITPCPVLDFFVFL